MPWFETVSRRPLIVDVFKTELFFRLTASINKTLLPLSHSFSTVAQDFYRLPVEIQRAGFIRFQLAICKTITEDY
jgi:hypothetical protein